MLCCLIKRQTCLNENSIGPHARIHHIFLCVYMTIIALSLLLANVVAVYNYYVVYKIHTMISVCQYIWTLQADESNARRTKKKDKEHIHVVDAFVRTFAFPKLFDLL